MAKRSKIPSWYTLSNFENAIRVAPPVSLPSDVWIGGYCKDGDLPLAEYLKQRTHLDHNSWDNAITSNYHRAFSVYGTNQFSAVGIRGHNPVVNDDNLIRQAVNRYPLVQWNGNQFGEPDDDGTIIEWYTDLYYKANQFTAERYQNLPPSHVLYGKPFLIYGNYGSFATYQKYDNFTAPDTSEQNPLHPYFLNRYNSPAAARDKIGYFSRLKNIIGWNVSWYPTSANKASMLDFYNVKHRFEIMKYACSDLGLSHTKGCGFYWPMREHTGTLAVGQFSHKRSIRTTNPSGEIRQVGYIQTPTTQNIAMGFLALWETGKRIDWNGEPKFGRDVNVQSINTHTEFYPDGGGGSTGNFPGRSGHQFPAKRLSAYDELTVSNHFYADSVATHGGTKAYCKFRIKREGDADWSPWTDPKPNGSDVLYMAARALSSDDPTNLNRAMAVVAETRVKDGNITFMATNQACHPGKPWILEMQHSSGKTIQQQVEGHELMVYNDTL
ncbi:hypothetical protein [Larkinella soli]|uniref:hypothetical protein n=1 Tax=Larkinella soli TaxID=1770527 RepID=UPI000FFC4A5B|nr:hypothetical protein [Larkinella soli]